MNRALPFLISILAAAIAGQQPRVPPAYVLGPDDQVVVRALEADELSDKPMRIDMSGYLRLPMVGRIQASGLTIDQLETEIAARLGKYVKAPEVSVSVTEFRSQPVAVSGSVKNPGIHQLQGRKTLIEILSLAGGLADDAGHSVKITRQLEWGRVPLPDAKDDLSGGFSVADVSLEAILEARNPAENVVILPHDVVSVPRAEMVYVVGQVPRAGGFILRERETLSALQALSLAGGLDKDASPGHARILRPSPGVKSRNEIPIDLKKIMSGQAQDVPLQSEDILFIPSSTPKKALTRVADTAVQITTGLIVFRR